MLSPHQYDKDGVTTLCRFLGTLKLSNLTYPKVVACSSFRPQTTQTK